MLKQSHNPEGYRNLLVYKKADELLAETLNFTAVFPREKTIDDLEDQMNPVRGKTPKVFADVLGHRTSNGVNRSARSVKANIVEGWKRNATHEYYTFLGYSIASNAELLEDYLDICNGHYEAKGVKGTKGENGGKGVQGKGRKGENGGKGTETPSSQFSSPTPASSSSPHSTSTHFPPSNPLPPLTSSTHSAPISISPLSQTPSTPLPPFNIHTLRFYPIDPSLPKAVQLFLRAKEMNFLLDSLQRSLVTRMEEKKTLSENDRMRLVREAQQKKANEANDWTKSQFTEQGLVLTGHGVKKKTDAEKLGLVWWEYGQPEK